MALKEFQILQKIGQGAYSTVHKVKRIQDNKIYALKQVKIHSLKQKEKQNALNQVRLLASISCQYIIKYKESFFDQKSSTLCIIMEYAENGDLQKLIIKNKERSQTVPETQIWKLAKHILSALNVLHQKHIIHRDLKSANIFITQNTYKIADLNVSKLLKHSLAYTQTGTPYYASPQVWQDKPYELKSDIWSLGCILYETAALKPPFTATSMDGLYKKVMKGVYPGLPGQYSVKLQNFISKCLQISPLKRPTSRQLLAMIPQTVQPFMEVQNHSHFQPQINLLQTIKVPRNLNSWRSDLPKADYKDHQSSETKNSTLQVNVSAPFIQNAKKYGQISHHKLRQIIKQKEQEKTDLDKKLSLRKINPQNHQKYDSVRSKIYTEHHDPPSSHYHQSSIPNLLAQEKSHLPRMNKIYSQAVNDLQNSRRLNDNHQRVQEILNRMKQAQRKKYAYNRPAWWG